jgi:hypothetical protein
MDKHNMHIHRRARTMAQILRIVLLGYDPCPKCTSFARDLKRRGLTCEKRTIDIDNPDPEHTRLIEEARRGNNGARLEAPIICLEDAEGSLTLVSAGYAMMTVFELVEQERQLQEMVLVEV